MCSVPGPDGLQTHFDQLREYTQAQHHLTYYAHMEGENKKEKKSHELDLDHWLRQQLELCQLALLKDSTV